MPNFFFKGQKVFANDIDVDRLARKIRQYSALCPDGQPLLNKDQALELVAHALGANSQYELRQMAKSAPATPSNHPTNERDISGMSTHEIQRLVWRQSITKGKPFPDNLPARFTTQRLEQMENLFLKAAMSRVPGKLEFVALVGQPGSGKTILAQHLCDKYGGRVIDKGVSISHGRGYRYGNGSVLVYDQPAMLPEKASVNIPYSEMQMVPHFTNLKEYRDYHRTRYVTIPHDDDFSMHRDWLRDNPQVTMVLCFASIEEAHTALRSTGVLFGVNSPGTASASLNWRRAHVVDLDNMRLTTLDGAGIELEEDRYAPRADAIA